MFGKTADTLLLIVVHDTTTGFTTVRVVGVT